MSRAQTIISNQLSYSGIQDGVNIRNPSTANFQIDSEDRSSGSSGDFYITTNQNLLAGFFTRLAVQEVVLDWCVPNVSAAAGNNVLAWLEVGGASWSITVPDGHYTAKTLMDTVIVLMNASGSPRTYALVDSTTAPGYKAITTTNGAGMVWTAGSLQSQLDLPLGYFNPPTNTVGWTASDMVCVKLLPYSYIDFVCDQLTANQSLKDSTTNAIHNRDTLYRWCFAWDVPPPVDAYGYPILQGYLPFTTRRAIAFPKQIRWRPDQPIGQLRFQIYNSQGEIVSGTAAGTNNPTGEFEFKFCCLVSEV